MATRRCSPTPQPSSVSSTGIENCLAGMRRRVGAVLLAPLLTLVAACGGVAGGYSDIRVEAVVVEMPPTADGLARVGFDIGWDVSFRDELNWDAA